VTETGIKFVQQSYVGEFERVVLPHVHQAYRLARWLARNDEDAEDIVQEACLRAFRFYESFQGGSVQPWLLKIVRNTYYTKREQSRTQQTLEQDCDLFGRDLERDNPEYLVIQKSGADLLRRALETLSPSVRQLIILREFEERSYREIAETLGVPMGTVMSGLSRARQRLRESVNGPRNVWGPVLD